MANMEILGAGREVPVWLIDRVAEEEEDNEQAAREANEEREEGEKSDVEGTK